MDASYYATKYNFPNYSESDNFNLVEDLKREFMISFMFSLPENQIRTFPHFKSCVYKIINILSYLKAVSLGKFNPDLIWRIVFNQKILMCGMTNYGAMHCGEQFMNMENNFSGTKNKKEEVKEQNNNTSLTDDALIFMGLSEKFTNNELIRSFRKLCLKYHPDKGGSQEKFVLLMYYKKILDSKITMQGI
jgi:hypothetical protein